MSLIEQLYQPLKQSFEAKGIRGVAVDIDDTLSATNLQWARQLLFTLGNPEALTPEQIISKYEYVRNVPYWPKERIEHFVQECFADETSLLGYPVLEGALPGIYEVQEVTPLLAYVTTRPDSMVDVTKAWLKRSSFPDADVVCLPHADLLQWSGIKSAMEWKAMLLEYLYPHISGIIDDNEEFIHHLSPSYRGSVCLLHRSPLIPLRTDLALYSCPTWHDVADAIRTELM